MRYCIKSSYFKNSFTLLSVAMHTCIIVVFVQQVRHPSTGQIMVLKKNIKATGTKTLREVELLRKLSHPNIVQ